MQIAHCGFPRFRIRDVADELGDLDESGQALEAGDLEFQGRGFETVGTRGVGGHGVRHDITGFVVSILVCRCISIEASLIAQEGTYLGCTMYCSPSFSSIEYT